MKKSILKIISVVLIVCFSWSGLLFVGKTRASLVDSEIAENNLYEADTLNFVLPQSEDFSPLITPSQNSTRTITVENSGNLNFTYKITTEFITGILCGYLTIQDAGGEIQPLLSFESPKVNFPDKSIWEFTAALDANDSFLKNQTCKFNFIFEGTQDDSGDGFSDTEKISNIIISGEWTGGDPPSPPAINFGDVIINEVMWMGSEDIDDPKKDGLKDQWIELKNVSGEDLHFGDLYLTYKNENTGNENKLVEIENNRVVKDGEYFLISHYKKNNSAINVQRDNAKIMNNFDFSKFQIKLYTNKDKSVLIDIAGDGGCEPTEGDKNNYHSMERNNIPSDGTDYGNWHTCLDPISTVLYWDSGRIERGTPGSLNLSQNDPSINNYETENKTDSFSGENENEQDNSSLPSLPVDEEEPMTKEIIITKKIILGNDEKIIPDDDNDDDDDSDDDKNDKEEKSFSNSNFVDSVQPPADY